MPQIDKISVEDAVRIGISLHKEGHVEEAEVVYRDILNAAPGQPDALHFLVFSNTRWETVKKARR